MVVEADAAAEHGDPERPIERVEIDRTRLGPHRPMQVDEDLHAERRVTHRERVVERPALCVGRPLLEDAAERAVPSVDLSFNKPAQ